MNVLIFLQVIPAALRPRRCGRTEAADFTAVSHLEFRLASQKFGPFTSGTRASVKVQTQRFIHRRRAQDSEDGVKRRDWVSFFFAAGVAAPQGPVAYNMLVPRRETGTDWKHKPGHPDLNHPRTTSSIIISWSGRRLNIKTTHHQFHTEASYLVFQFTTAGSGW